MISKPRRGKEPLTNKSQFTQDRTLQLLEQIERNTAIIATSLGALVGHLTSQRG